MAGGKTIDEREQDFKRTFESCCLPPGVYSEFRRHLEQVRQEEREQMKMRLLMYPLLHPEKLEEIMEYVCSFREAKVGDDGER